VSLLKSIPKIDKFINNKEFEGFSTSLITQISKDIITKLRDDILKEKIDNINEADLIQAVKNKYKKIYLQKQT